MVYSRTYLNSFKSENGYPTNEQHNVTQQLINKLYDDSELSLSEEQYACNALSSLRSDDPEFRIKVSEVEKCKNYWFRDRYLLYYSDLNGYRSKRDFYGELGNEQKQLDIEYLESEYQKWIQIIGSKTQEKLIGEVAKETKSQIKTIKKHCQNLNIGYFRHEYLKKEIVLHGKYIYYLVKEFYQELGSDHETITLFNCEILIDSYCYVHILFRHFASQVKEHQTSKSYHFDENIRFDMIPQFLKLVIIKFSENISETDFDGRTIYFSFHNKKYLIGINQNQKLTTFYPISEPSILNVINGYNSAVINNELTFLLPNK